MERLEELESLIDQLENRLEKALAGGSEHQINEIRKEIKKFGKERDTLFETEGTCSCSVK